MKVQNGRRKSWKYVLGLLSIYIVHIFLAYLHTISPHNNVISPSEFEIRFVEFTSRIPRGLIVPWQILYYIGFPIFVISGIALVIRHGKGKSIVLACSLAIACAWLFYWIAVLYEPTYVGAAPKDMVLLPFQNNYDLTNITSGPALCFPSLHVTISVLLGLYLVSIGFKKYGTTNAVLISLSALLTAQHWLRDVIAGTILAIGCFLIAEGISRELSS